MKTGVHDLGLTRVSDPLAGGAKPAYGIILFVRPAFGQM